MASTSQSQQETVSEDPPMTDDGSLNFSQSLGDDQTRSYGSQM